MSKTVVTGQVWTRTFSSFHETVVLMGRTISNRIRVLKVTCHMGYTTIRYTVLKEETIRTYYQKTDMTFLIRNGSPRAFVKKSIEDIIKTDKRDIIRLQRNISKLSQLMKTIESLGEV